MTAPPIVSAESKGLDEDPRYPKDYHFMELAFEEAQKGYDEGGVPIGAVLVSRTGVVLGRGHNMRIQRSSATLHAEIAAFESAGRLSAEEVRGATMYTTLSPCVMCTGACLLYKIDRVVMGENDSYMGAEDLLRSRGMSSTIRLVQVPAPPFSASRQVRFRDRGGRNEDTNRVKVRMEG